MNATNSADGRATRTRATFRMECGVAIDIQAPREKIWLLLTPGQKIRLRVPIAPKRVFKLEVSAFEPGARMVWSDGAAPMFRGVRTFTLSPKPNGATEFSMIEVFSGLMLPMIAGSLPDFAPSFEQYAADLKRAAEGSPL